MNDPYLSNGSTFGTFIGYYCDAITLTFTGGYNPNSTVGQYWGRTNYFSVAGAIGDPPGVNYYGTWTGMFVNRATRSLTKLTSAGDGSSNTFFFGEGLGGCQNASTNAGGPTAGNRDFSSAWMGAGSFATAWGLGDPAAWYQLSSKHTSVVQFAMGDGSVRGLRRGGSDQ